MLKLCPEVLLALLVFVRERFVEGYLAQVMATGGLCLCVYH